MPHSKRSVYFLPLVLALVNCSNLLPSTASAGAPFPQLNDAEQISYAFGKAVRYSGIAPFPATQMPPIYRVTKAELGAEVCPTDPENCSGLAAAFDDLSYRILVRDDFDLQANFDISFLIHEIVHALQYRARGAEIFRDCQSIYDTESEAYRAQDRYLKDEGEFFRASIALRSFKCEEASSRADYLKSKAVWDERVRDGWFEQQSK